MPLLWSRSWHGALAIQEIKTQTIGLALYYGKTTYVIYACLFCKTLDKYCGAQYFWLRPSDTRPWMKLIISLVLFWSVAWLNVCLRLNKKLTMNYPYYLLIFRFNLTSNTSWILQIGTESTSMLPLLEQWTSMVSSCYDSGEGATKFEHNYFPAILIPLFYIYGLA